MRLRLRCEHLPATGSADGPTEHYWRGLDGTELFCHWMRGSYALLYGAPGTLPQFEAFSASAARY